MPNSLLLRFTVYCLFVAPLLVVGQQVSVDLACYLPGQGFRVTFAGANAVDDWVGFVPVASLKSNLVVQEGEYQAWSWKCGATFCAPASGTVFVSNTLAAGEYVAVLLRNSVQGPFQGFARSPVLRVAADCGANTAVAQPKVSVDGTTFDVGVPFWINFSGHNATVNSDFIAIFPADMPPTQLLDGNLWKWTCNRQGGFCAQGLAQGRVRMDSAANWTSTWPLQAGSYKAYLLRNQANPFWIVIATSEAFSIVARNGPTVPVRAPVVQPILVPVRAPTQAPQRQPVIVNPVPTPFTVPVRPPTLVPVRRPTSSPVGVTQPGAIVSVAKSSFAVGESIVVSYRQHSTHTVSDFIAIFPADAPSNALPDGLLWKWASCDRQGNFCPSSSTSGSVTIGPNSSWLSTWTLPAGSYKAFLLKNLADPFWQVIASSTVFTISAALSPVTAPSPVAVPTPVAVPAPIAVPVPVASPSSVGSGSNAKAAQDLANARSMIERMIASDADLAPKFLRLIFHDCIGGCDGCVDLTNPENFGLEKPIDALEPVFEQHGGTVSRADLWALSATVAVDVVQSQNDAIDFPFNFWGREDCTLRSTCVGAGGQSVPCTPKFGPHHEHPSIHLNTADLYHFFASEFGFSAREAIVAMAGGHTIGGLTTANSGINGPNGWVPNNKVFDKEYFDETIGGNSPTAPISVLVNEAPRWRRAIEPPQGVFQNRRVWDGFPAPDKRIIMLNTDIALFRVLNSTNYDSTNGRARCGFEDDTSREASIPQCPHLVEAVLIGAELKHNNVRFKTEFRDVLVKMVSIGYERVFCNDAACKLSKR